jgi:cysteine-rich repeat protein
MRSRIWARLCGVLALAFVTLPARVLATTAADLCAPAADPCVVSTAVVVTGGSMIDVGTRALRIDSGGALDVGGGAMTIVAGQFTLNNGGFLRALGSSSAPGGSITVQAAAATIAGTVDASGAPGGSVAITATGTLSATGPITARALAREHLGGAIDLTAGTLTLAGPLSVVGGPDAVGGDLTLDAVGNLTLTGSLDASGGDGGGIDIQAGTPTSDGNIVLADTAVVRADATNAGGFGGSADLTALGDGVTTGLVTINAQLSVIGLSGSEDLGGGSGGCIDVQATGSIRIDRGSARLNADGGAPDGDGGEIDITSDTGSVVLLGTATASVLGPESSGGAVTIDARTDAVLSGSILITAGDGGGGEATVSSFSSSVSVARSGVIDVSSTSAGQGGGICLETGTVGSGARSVLVEGRLSANGGPSGGGGGGIDLAGGDSVRIAGTGMASATGGGGGGSGGTINMTADPGIASIEGPLLATGGGPNGPGGVIAIEASGRIDLNARADAGGFGTGGQIGIATDTGPVEILNNLTASSSSAAGGTIEIIAQGRVRVAGTLVSTGSVAPGGRIEIVGCAVTVCGLDSPSCPSGGRGVLMSQGPSGTNRLTGRNSTAVLGTLRAANANQNGRNELVYDGQEEHEPLVLGQVTPNPVLIVDAGLVPCPVCGNRMIEPPETCDDGNVLDGDGCSSSCQTEESIPGDANGDGVVSADDIGFAIQEIFDGDGDSITAVSGGSFPGAPGVDANGDDIVTAADLTATIRLIVAP